MERKQCFQFVESAHIDHAPLVWRFNLGSPCIPTSSTSFYTDSRIEARDARHKRAMYRIVIARYPALSNRADAPRRNINSSKYHGFLVSTFKFREPLTSKSSTRFSRRRFPRKISWVYTISISPDFHGYFLVWGSLQYFRYYHPQSTRFSNCGLNIKTVRLRRPRENGASILVEVNGCNGQRM